MSAITTHREEDAPHSEEEGCQLGGDLGALSCFSPLEAMHSEQVRTVWIRRTLEDALAGCRFRVVDGVELGKEDSADRRRLYLQVDRTLSLGTVPWMPAALEFSDTAMIGEAQKMACPTWDLPAGAMAFGGSCPGADAGQSTVPEEKRRGRLRVIQTEVRLEETICESCVTGDSPVLVRGIGVARIDDMVDAGEFETWSGKAWRRTRAVCNGVRPVVEITTNWGSRLRLTADHEVLTTWDGMRRTDELEVGERLAFEPPPSSPFPATSPIRHAEGGNFPSEWTRGVGELLGYLVGDGAVAYGQYPTISIAKGAQDRSDLDRFQHLVASWCGTKTEVKIRVPEANEYCDAPKEQAHVAWRVLEFSRFVLGALEFDRRTSPEQRRVPAGVWKASEDGVAGFISGLFSSDGSVTVNGSGKVEVTVASVSERLLQEVQLLLFAFGIRSSICPFTTSNREREADGNRALFKLGINALEHVRLFERKIGFFNERKAARLRSALEANKYRSGMPRYPIVTSVRPCLVEEPVYDLVDVGEEHQFVANGISVHNCYATGGNYASPHVQAGEIVRLWWAREAVKGDGRVFVETLVRAIQGETFPVERQGILPFRLHSAGDFFSYDYAKCWMEVARRVPEVTFWAPTRTWAAGPHWIEFWAQSQLPPNLIIRPSAYHTDDPSPHPDGGSVTVPNRAGQPETRPVNPWVGPYPFNAAGSTSIYKLQNLGEKKDPRYDWNCKTYSNTGKNSHTCRQALAPDGKIGCRMCWTRPDLRPNYTTH